jgi:hypothetical protein
VQGARLPLPPKDGGVDLFEDRLGLALESSVPSETFQTSLEHVVGEGAEQ